MEPCSFFCYSRTSLEQKIASLFGPEKAAFYAKSAFHEVYKSHFYSQDCSFPRLKTDVRQWIKEEISFDNPVEIDEYFISREDSSVKFILKLKKDSLRVEAVLIPERSRFTLCVSTQVGCAQACRFCQTGRMGLLRSLSCEEIVGQLIAVERWRKENHETIPLPSISPVTNIVYMGMGEPLDNVDNVIESASIFCDPQAFFLSHNKVTVSTVGLLPQLDKLLKDSPVCLALSLHSPFEEERTKIMPVNVGHPLTAVIESLKNHLTNGSRKSFLVQYTLIRGVNDTPAHAEAIVNLLSPYNFKINLIPLNEHEGTSYRRPDLSRVFGFQQILKKGGLVATIRLSKGRDIAAACGQLIKGKKDVQ